MCDFKPKQEKLAPDISVVATTAARAAGAPRRVPAGPDHELLSGEDI